MRIILKLLFIILKLLFIILKLFRAIKGFILYQIKPMALKSGNNYTTYSKFRHHLILRIATSKTPFCYFSL